MDALVLKYIDLREFLLTFNIAVFLLPTYPLSVRIVSSVPYRGVTAFHWPWLQRYVVQLKDSSIMLDSLMLAIYSKSENVVDLLKA